MNSPKMSIQSVPDECILECMLVNSTNLYKEITGIKNKYRIYVVSFMAVALIFTGIP